MTGYAIADYATQEKLHEILKKLYEKNCLIPFKDNEEFDKIFRRTNSIMHVSEAKYLILGDEELLKEYKRFWAGHFVDEFDLYNDFMQQAASYLLSMFEHIKRFFLMILNLEKLGLNEKSTLGTIVSKIGDTCDESWESISKLFDIDTRNIIAHDNWYYKEKKFAYNDQNNIEQIIPLNKLVEKIKYATALGGAVSIAWFKYMPTLEKEYKRK